MKLNKTSLLPLALALFVMGCETGMPVTSPPVDPVFKPASRNVAANATQPAYVRTYTRSSKGRSEVAGIPCTLDSPYFQAKVVTPAVVRLPSYANSTPPVTVRCEMDGKALSKTTKPYNKTVQDRTSSLGGGLLGLAIASAATNNANAVYAYPPLEVEFPE